MIWRKKREKVGMILILISICALALLSFSPVSNILLFPLEFKFNTYTIENHKEDIKFIVVLGGGHIPDPAVPITSQISSNSLVRLTEGIRIYHNYPGSKLILSGGGIGLTCAEIMAEATKIFKIKREDIIIEAVSRDTKDEAIFIKSIVGDNRFVLVTSASHMPRSIALFRKLGMEPIPAPTNHLAIKNPYSTFRLPFPGAGGLTKSERVFYEYLGLAWAKLRGQI